jgi:hypothetical protein
MEQNPTRNQRENYPSKPVKRDRLFLVNGRYTTVHYPDRVSIVEIRDHKKVDNIHPVASIPVAKTMTDAEACLLALHWLQDHDYITAKECDRHAMNCMTAESRGRLKLLRHDELEITVK